MVLAENVDRNVSMNLFPENTAFEYTSAPPEIFQVCREIFEDTSIC
jgi:hypothetical protein